MWVSTTISRLAAPRVWRKEPIVFRREKNTAAPIKSMDTGTKAISALSKVAFMALGSELSCKKRPSNGRLALRKLYQNLAFEAFDDFIDFVESVSCEILKNLSSS